MDDREWTMEDAAAFGISPADEGPHPFARNHQWWNESVFWDWYDSDGANAGHCRIGWHPNQERLWLWLFLYNGSDWVAIEEPRLPLSSLKLPAIAYDDGWGLSFSYTPARPLRSGRLEVAGFGRVISGPRCGLILPVAVELEVESVGPPHSTGEANIEGHRDEVFSTNRFEQPIRAACCYSVGGEQRRVEVRGERDHSWGPRMWNMEWTVMVTNTEQMRIMSACVNIPGLPRIEMGYLQREAVASLTSVSFDLDYDDATPTRPFAGGFSLKADDGSGLSGEVEALTGAEIDITHTFEPPRRSLYRRALIRCRPRGEEPSMGWIESNRFID